MTHGPPEAPTLSAMMLLLVALTATAGVLFVVPAVFVLRYFTSWPIVWIAAGFVLMLAAPFVFAWRTRPF